MLHQYRSPDRYIMSSLNTCSAHVCMTWMEMWYLSTFSRLGEYFFSVGTGHCISTAANLFVNFSLLRKERGGPRHTNKWGNKLRVTVLRAQWGAVTHRWTQPQPQMYFRATLPIKPRLHYTLSELIALIINMHSFHGPSLNGIISLRILLRPRP